VLGEVLTAIVTPFREDGSVDLERFRALAAHLVENGSDGLVVTGTTGESPTLSDEEKVELWRAAVETVGDRAAVIAGSGTYSTSHSVHLTELAHEAGVDGFLVVYPYYNKPPMRGFVEHVRAIASASDRPLMIYNIPARTVGVIDTPTFAVLAELPTVRSVKQAHDDFQQAREIVELGLELYCGDDGILLRHLEVGAVGVVSVTAHVAGAKTKQLIQAFRGGDRARAQALNGELQPAFDLLTVQVNPVAIKAALNLLGHEVGGLRLPLVEATAGETARVRECLERLGVTAAAPA
jgi:4-hydroxy-tetrahydrodipicolinate synthase